VVGSDRVRRVVDAYRDKLMREVLAVEVSTDQPLSGGDRRDLDVEGEAVHLGAARV
jgi:hypothetical protein